MWNFDRGVNATSKRGQSEEVLASELDGDLIGEWPLENVVRVD